LDGEGDVAGPEVVEVGVDAVRGEGPDPAEEAVAVAGPNALVASIVTLPLAPETVSTAASMVSPGTATSTTSAVEASPPSRAVVV